ncbi:MAG: DNA mismatch repair protein, partial [Cruoricaptor ignavus]|nr:DNA mismatch repair protein [Cruoricaptor ignavus]
QVSVLDEDLGGIITSVHGEEVVFRDKHGFLHRYSKTDLVTQTPDIYDGITKIEKYKEAKHRSKKHHKTHFVIDLHFDKLVDNPLAYDSFERLFIQKEKLLEGLEFCRTHRLKKLEIIHGLGDGTLQKLVYDTLESQSGLDFGNREILHHQSASVMVEIH